MRSILELAGNSPKRFLGWLLFLTVFVALTWVGIRYIPSTYMPDGKDVQYFGRMQFYAGFFAVSALWVAERFRK